MRTIVREMGPFTPHQERFDAVNSREAMEIELLTPFECRQLLPALAETYLAVGVLDKTQTERVNQIYAHLADCDPAEVHTPFVISHAEALQLEKTFKGRASLKADLQKSTAIGIASLMGLLEGEIGEVYKEKYQRDHSFPVDDGKIALRAVRQSA